MQGDTAAGSRAVRMTVAGLSVAALLLTAGCWVGLTAVNGVENQITVDDSISNQLASATPDVATPSAGATAAAPQEFTAENILVVGSDTRTGQGSAYGSTADASGNGHSDTAFILHVAADRKSAFAVNIPRDSWVQRPSCNADGSSDGTLVRADKFNKAYAVGGRACVIRAVKYLTNVPITHFVEVKLLGFKAIVDALGGVTVCATRRLYDPVRPDGHGGNEGSDLDLPKGTSHIGGEMALALARARHIPGSTGSDLQRIDHQQLLLHDLIQEASDSHLATDPLRLYDVLSKIAGSLTVDKGLSGDALKTFILSMSSMKPSDITFYTVPWKPHPDGEDVLWVTSKAVVMWNAMIHDTAYPPAASPSPKPSSSSTTSSSSPSSTAKAACFS